MSVLIIAEIASAHDGDYDRACRLVDAAADAGADIVKAQYFHDPDLMAERRRVPDRYRDIYRRYSIPLSWVRLLSERAHVHGLQFACSVFVPGAAVKVVEWCDWLKVASFENDTDLRGEVSGFPLIISAGMCSEGQLRALKLWRDLVYRDVRVLHCVSCYRSLRLADTNLGVILKYGLDGFSDHVNSKDAPDEGVKSGEYAVNRGARMLEKHIRLDDTDPQNPDYAPALNPEQFKEYVRLARLADAAGGDGVKRCLPCEEEMAQYKVKG